MLRVCGLAAAFVMLMPIGFAKASPAAAGQGLESAVSAARPELVQAKAKPRAKLRKAPRKGRRIGSSGTVNLTPVQPNAPVGPDLSAPRAGPRAPSPMAAPSPQPPYATPSGAYPVPSRRPGETFQDRASRCQHAAGVHGVPEASRGGYVGGCL